MSDDEEASKIDPQKEKIPYTARLNAHYRALENAKDDPLFRDPYAEHLAGDMSHLSLYLKERSGLQVSRHHYIDTEIITPWCETHKESQIVILGAGLDTRAYRLEPLQKHNHTIFEIDLPLLIEYKKKTLDNEEPLCNLVRVPADLSNPIWTRKLLNHGFSSEISTLWILEGLVYYIDKDIISSLLKRAQELSIATREIFVDVCVPALADLDFGPYSSQFKWGIEKQDVISFFAATGWDVSSFYADDYSYGRDVGQRGIIYVHGVRTNSLFTKQTGRSTESLDSVNPQLFAIDFAKKTIPVIETIVHAYTENANEGLKSFLYLMRSIKTSVQVLVHYQGTPLNIGHISPRLLSDPLSIEEKVSTLDSEEVESHITGYLKAVLNLSYCSILNITGHQFHQTGLYKVGMKSKTIESILPLVAIVKSELQVSHS
jgi:methyltransferase (TIGR00027 family)